MSNARHTPSFSGENLPRRGLSIKYLQYCYFRVLTTLAWKFTQFDVFARRRFRVRNVMVEVRGIANTGVPFQDRAGLFSKPLERNLTLVSHDGGWRVVWEKYRLGWRGAWYYERKANSHNVSDILYRGVWEHTQEGGPKTY